MSKRTPAVDRQKEMGGRQQIYRFDNGYGASVISGRFAYGGDAGLFELAVLNGFSGEPDSLDFSLCYDTPITDDVIGYLSWADVEGLLDRIASLPASESEGAQQ